MSGYILGLLSCIWPAGYRLNTFGRSRRRAYSHGVCGEAADVEDEDNAYKGSQSLGL